MSDEVEGSGQIMLRRIVYAFVLLFFLVAGPSSLVAATDPELLTVAEKTEFRATALHADVILLVERLAASSPLARRLSLGTSFEGRDIPLLVMSDPPVGSAAEAREQIERDGKLLVLAIGNIHAGEVDGKEALPMLARELLGVGGEGEGGQADLRPLLKRVIVAFAPIYNCDGNERVSKTNRGGPGGQVGPEEGMGIRENSQGFDLNRDFVKLEAPETAGLVEFFNEWDPHVFVDCHTTNGSLHRYVLTYAGPKMPAGDAELIRYSREAFFPALSRVFDVRNGGGSFWYGSFEGAFTEEKRVLNSHGKWETFPAEGRYGTNYVGLRNRLGILSEAYAYASFKERVIATRDFVRAVIELSAANRGRIARLTRDADERAVAAGNKTDDENDVVAVRTKAAAWPDKVLVRGWREEMKDGREHSTGGPADYEVELWDRFEATMTVKRPWAYIIAHAGGTEPIVAKLRQHGIAVEEIPGGGDFEVVSLTVTDLSPASRAFQGHVLARVDVAEKVERRTMGNNSYLVRTGQPLGSLACFLLEPACEDGLCAWNFYDRWLKAGEELPVYRVMNPLGQDR